MKQAILFSFDVLGKLNSGTFHATDAPLLAAAKRLPACRLGPSDPALPDTRIDRTTSLMQTKNHKTNTVLGYLPYKKTMAQVGAAGRCPKWLQIDDREGLAPELSACAQFWTLFLVAEKFAQQPAASGLVCSGISFVRKL
ncbi:MAG: hypothetical protein H2060_00205 [Azoarcus sp.]|nr:hypothetical protein [Azoarcus sp.]